MYQGTDVVVNHYTGKQIAGVLFTVTPFQGMANQCVLKAAREVIHYYNLEFNFLKSLMPCVCC